MIQLFPSLISANLLQLQEEITLIEPHVAGFHLDVMDFHFVPNLTWGPAFVNQIRAASKKQLFVHLMTDYPETYFDRMHLNRSDIISVHWESKTSVGIEGLLASISSRGLTPSIALNPATPITILNTLDPKLIQNILIMTVEPGFSGQSFIPEMLEKIAQLALWRKEKGLQFTIAVDGGVSQHNAGELVKRGAQQLAAASAIFDNPDRVAAINNILKNS